MAKIKLPWIKLGAAWKPREQRGRCHASGQPEGWLAAVLNLFGWSLVIMEVQSDNDRAPDYEILLAPPSDDDDEDEDDEPQAAPARRSRREF